MVVVEVVVTRRGRTVVVVGRTVVVVGRIVVVVEVVVTRRGRTVVVVVVLVDVVTTTCRTVVEVVVLRIVVVVVRRTVVVVGRIVVVTGLSVVVVTGTTEVVTTTGSDVDVTTVGRDVVVVTDANVVVVGRTVVVVGRIVVVVVEVDVVDVDVDVDVVATVPPPLSCAGTVTVIDCGEPVRVVLALPAVSVTENVPDPVRVDVTAPPPAVAVEVALMVQTVLLVCTIDEMAEMPAVRTKSVPVEVVAVVDNVAQSIPSLPVIVKLIDSEVEVALDRASVTVVGAVRSIVIDSDEESSPTFPAASV